MAKDKVLKHKLQLLLKNQLRKLCQLLQLRTPAAKPAVNKAAPVSEQKAAPAPAKASQGETTVRVDTKRLDQIMNMVGELVLSS